jgi:hypothetical protein
MVIISPLLVFLYILSGTVLLFRYVGTKKQWLVALIGNLRLQGLQLAYKKQLSFRPKAVRLH